jgi:hypothetical protein
VTSKSVDAPGNYSYSSYYSLSVYDGQVQSDSYWGDEFLRLAAQAVVEERLALAQSQPGWDGDFYGSASFYGPLNVGTQTVAFSWWESYGVASRSVFVPVITWEAETFEQFKADWPEPTLHGLLPGMGSSDELFATFGITADEWQREAVLDWTDLNFGLAGSPLPPSAPRLRRPR